MSVIVKPFPRFDRFLFGNPEQLFTGWRFEDFVALSDSSFSGILHRQVDFGVIRANFPGWITDDIPSYNENTAVHKNGWGIDYNVEGQIFISPLALNLDLFPYYIRVRKDEKPYFIYDGRGRLDTGDIGYTQSYSFFIRHAAANTKLPFSQALLLTSFVNTFGLLDSKAVDEVREFTNFNVPFEVMSNTLVSLSGKGFEEIVDSFPEVKKIFHLANQVVLSGEFI